MGVADSSVVFTARGRRYRFDESESMMVDYIDLAEVGTKQQKDGEIIEQSLRRKRWTSEEFLALIPGGFVGGGFAALVQRVKDEMDAGWQPLG